MPLGQSALDIITTQPNAANKIEKKNKVGRRNETWGWWVGVGAWGLLRRVQVKKKKKKVQKEPNESS